MSQMLYQVALVDYSMSLDIAETTLNACPYIVCHDFDLIYYMHACCNIIIDTENYITHTHNVDVSRVCATVHKNYFLYQCISVSMFWTLIEHLTYIYSAHGLECTL